MGRPREDHGYDPEEYVKVVFHATEKDTGKIKLYCNGEDPEHRGGVNREETVKVKRKYLAQIDSATIINYKQTPNPDTRDGSMGMQTKAMPIRRFQYSVVQ